MYCWVKLLITATQWNQWGPTEETRVQEEPTSHGSQPWTWKNEFHWNSSMSTESLINNMDCKGIHYSIKMCMLEKILIPDQEFRPCWDYCRHMVAQAVIRNIKPWRQTLCNWLQCMILWMWKDEYSSTLRRPVIRKGSKSPWKQTKSILLFWWLPCGTFLCVFGGKRVISLTLPPITSWPLKLLPSNSAWTRTWPE